MVFAFWKQNPQRRIVDVGCGSGVFRMFHNAGVVTSKLLAVELYQPPFAHLLKNTYWDITRDDNFQVSVDDILFVAWGHGISAVIRSYMKPGESTIIILGEKPRGCTFPVDFLSQNKKWRYEVEQVQVTLGNTTEFLSFNTRILSE